MVRQLSHGSGNGDPEQVRPFLTSTNIRAIASQPDRSLDLRDVMDQERLLIAITFDGTGQDWLPCRREQRVSPAPVSPPVQKRINAASFVTGSVDSQLHRGSLRQLASLAVNRVLRKPCVNLVRQLIDRHGLELADQGRKIV